MPFVDLETNLPASRFPEDFLKRLASAAAVALGKPEDRMMVLVKPDLRLLIGGSCAPGVVLSLAGIGVTDTAEKNRETSAKLFPFLTQELGLGEDRIVIRFSPLESSQVGKKGTVLTFM